MFPPVYVHFAGPELERELQIAALAASLAPYGEYPVQLACGATQADPLNRHVLK